jgi:3-phenylpropionate/trans-cinnamate dioxygenase ferredoxin reductase subunit
LRDAGFDEPITMVGKEPYLPYDRPPLSKQMLAGTRGPDDLTLRSAAEIRDLGIDLHVGDPAAALRANQVILRSGRQLPFRQLVISTGVTARRLPGQPPDPRIHMLRTVEDAVALRAQLGRARSLLTVGGGFIGAEVAAAARAADLDVTMVEALAVPFARVLGRQAGEHCAQLHLNRGVKIVTGAQVRELIAGSDAVGVRLADESVLEADCLVVGVGTVPSTSWLAGSGLPVANGILCDENGRVTGSEHIYAVGDVAAWHSPEFGDQVRVEHWDSAVGQARRVAQAVMGRAGSAAGPRALPYFWSDQYDTRLQLLGRPDVSTSVHLHRHADHPERLLGLYFREGHLVAALAINSARALAQCRPLIASGAGLDTARCALPEFEKVHRTGPRC